MVRLQAIVGIVFAICISHCAAGFAQTQPTVSEFDNKSNKQKAPFKLAQKIDNPKTGATTDQKTVDKKPTPPPVTKQRRTELMTFVKAHHPEIRPLLNSLQKNRPTQYQAALRTLDRGPAGTL